MGFLFLLSLSAVGSGGCAGSKVSSRRMLVDEATLARPSVLLVYRFAVDPDEVVVDTFGPAFLGSSATYAEKNELGYRVADLLAERIVIKVRERGIHAQRATHDTVPPMDAMIAKGQFVTLTEGDKAGRVVVGFGRGTSEIRIQVQHYQVTKAGLLRVHEGDAVAHGSKKPGMAASVAGGAAAGTAATAAVVSGGVSVASDRGGTDADVERLADLYAERLEAFYRRRGWL